MTKEELRQYPNLVKNIKILEDELAELECAATNMSITFKEDIIDYTAEKDKISGNVIRIIELQKIINDQLERKHMLRVKIEDAVSILPEEDETIIRLRYIQGYTWEKIAVEMGYSFQWIIKRIHPRALSYLYKKSSLGKKHP